MTGGTGALSHGGLRDAFGRMGANALALVHTRIALAGVELAEERDRLKIALTLVVVGVVFSAFAMMTATIFVIALFWDTHREAAIIGVTLFYALVAVLSFWRASSLRHGAPAPFAATLAELEKDRERLSAGFLR